MRTFIEVTRRANGGPFLGKVALDSIEGYFGSATVGQTDVFTTGGGEYTYRGSITELEAEFKKDANSRV